MDESTETTFTLRHFAFHELAHRVIYRRRSGHATGIAQPPDGIDARLVYWATYRGEAR